MEPAKIQGDKLEISEPAIHKESFVLGNRPIDVDQEKKHGDPLFDAAVFKEPQPEVIHTGKLARELPEYHQGEARLRPAAVKAEPLPTEVLAAQAAALAENAKEIAEESKEFVEEKAHNLYDTAVKEADVLLEKAYEGEQYLLEKAVDAEHFIEEKGKAAYKKSEDILVNTIAPAVGYALGSAYVALKSATGFAVEKGMEEAEYLKEKAAEIGEEVAKEAKVLGEEAKILGEEAAIKGSELAKEAAAKGSELAMEAAVVGSELAKEAAAKGSEIAKEAAAKGSELAKEAAIKAQEGLVVASEVGKEALLSAADKTDKTMEYLEKEAVHLSQEGMDYLNQQKEIVAEKIDHMAEEAKHNPEAAMLLRELADETEIKRKKELDEATRLRMKHDEAAHAAARKANFLQHERAFEKDISSHLTSSLRESHVEAEDRALEEGGYEPLIDSPAIIPLEPIADSPIMVVERDELKPLLPHQAAPVQVESRDIGLSQLPSSQLESLIPIVLPTAIPTAPIVAPITTTTVTTTFIPAAVPSVPIALPTTAPMVTIVPTGPNLAEAKYYPQLVERMGSDATTVAPTTTFTN